MGELPVSGSAGRSDSLFLDEKEDLRGTGKNPRKKRAMPITSNIKMNDAKTDERTFILLVDGYFKGRVCYNLLASNRHDASHTFYPNIREDRKP